MKAMPLLKRIYSKVHPLYTLLFGYGIYENVNNTKHTKRALLKYIVEPFRKAGPENYRHQNYAQVKDIAHVLGSFGYTVDVVQFDDSHVRYTKQYDLIIDTDPSRAQQYQRHCTPTAKRIAYLTTANPAFNNRTEDERLTELYKRRGVHLTPGRKIPLLQPDAFKSFDALFLIGNSVTLESYKDFVLPPVHFIPNTGYAFLENHNHLNRSAESFLFLAGSGAVHKGLDLLLEVFAKRPELHLYIHSKLNETDFSKLYHKELFETPNIHFMGIADITSPTFRTLAEKCAYVIAPSCAEGMSGSVLVGMSCGLIPVISKECGIDTGALTLPDCTLATIGRTVDELSKKSKGWLAEQSEQAMSIIQKNYLPEHFKQSWTTALSEVVK